jgi:hypothetical protein
MLTLNFNFFRRNKSESEHKKHIRNALVWARTIHNMRKREQDFLETEDMMFQALKREIIQALITTK